VEAGTQDEVALEEGTGAFEDFEDFSGGGIHRGDGEGRAAGLATLLRGGKRARWWLKPLDPAGGLGHFVFFGNTAK
jgi:hypothetical protein